MKRFGCLGIAMIGLAAIVASFFAYMAWNTHTVRFQLTVEIETPDGVKTGSSVVETNWTWQRPVAGIPFTKHVRGEAVFVDLGSGKHVVSLLVSGTTGEGVDWPTYLWQTFRQARKVEHVWQVLSATRAESDVQIRWLPTFVNFSDINDPTTARVVYAGGSICLPRPGRNDCNSQDIRDEVKVDQFEQVFGPGYGFRRMTVRYVNPGLWITHVWPLSLVSGASPEWLFGMPTTKVIEQKMPRLRNPETWNSALRALPRGRNSLTVGSMTLKREF
jgi:hypothetical protein